MTSSSSSERAASFISPSGSGSGSSSISPSSVRWHYNNRMMNPYKSYPPFYYYDNQYYNDPQDYCYDEDEDESNQLSEAWNVPPSSEMKRRSILRKRILEETLQHRRVHRHGGMKGRNICHVLHDRQITGKPRPAGGSPAAFFNVPPFPLSSSSSSPGNVNVNVNINANAVASPAETTEANTNANTNTKSSPPLSPISSSVSIQKEIQCFAEYCSVLRYHSAFLSHLGGQDVIASMNLMMQQQQQQQQQSQSNNNNNNGSQQQSNQQQSSSSLPQPQPVVRLSNSSTAISTISIAFSPDSKTMASTHGDHTVKITHCANGNLLETLVGHPRTPWTVKYHPTDPAILASGCLGHQVRLWNWMTQTCLHMIRLEFAIISLSFHPSGQVLAIANGTRLHFWSFANTNTLNPNNNNKNNNDTNNNNNSNTTLGAAGSTTTSSSSSFSNNNNNSNATTNSNNNNTANAPVTTEVEQRHMLRCVHFPPNGTTIIVGGVNPPTTTDSSHSQHRGAGGVSGGGMSFYLRLWDFDLQAALHPGGERERERDATNNHSSNATGGGGVSLSHHMGLRRRVIGNPRTFVPRALLYNDGGFDVSPDGKTLCACAEYWLPNDVDSVMDLIKRQQQEDEAQHDEYEQDDTDSIVDEPSQIHQDQMPEDTDAMDETDDHHDIAIDNDDNNYEDQNHAGDDDNATPTQDNAFQQVSPPRAQIGMHGAASAAHAGHAPPRPVLTTPQTPPTNPGRVALVLSPPSPPGRRFAGGLGQPRHHHYTQHRGIPPPSAATTIASTNMAQTPQHARQRSIPPNPATISTNQSSATNSSTSNSSDAASSPAIPPPPPPGMSANANNRPPNPFTTLTSSTGPPPGSNNLNTNHHHLPRNQRQANFSTSSSSSAPPPPNHYHYNTSNPIYMDPSTTTNGRYVPHVVTISMDTTPVVNDIVPGRNIPRNHLHHPNHYANAAAAAAASGAATSAGRKSKSRSNNILRPRLGELLEACPLDGSKASAVTCVKFSPSTNFCLIGFGVRETLVEHNGNQYHPVTALYKIKGGMTHVSTMLSSDDDVNIARFHPESGYGFVYGTKQGRVRVLSPRPWNYYNC